MRGSSPLGFGSCLPTSCRAPRYARLVAAEKEAAEEKVFETPKKSAVFHTVTPEKTIEGVCQFFQLDENDDSDDSDDGFFMKSKRSVSVNIVSKALQKQAVEFCDLNKIDERAKQKLLEAPDKLAERLLEKGLREDIRKPSAYLSRSITTGTEQLRKEEQLQREETWLEG